MAAGACLTPLIHPAILFRKRFALLVLVPPAPLKYPRTMHSTGNGIGFLNDDASAAQLREFAQVFGKVLKLRFNQVIFDYSPRFA